MGRVAVIERALHTYFNGQVLEPTDERLRELARYIDNSLTSAKHWDAVERKSFDGIRITIEVGR